MRAALPFPLAVLLTVVTALAGCAVFKTNRPATEDIPPYPPPASIRAEATVELGKESTLAGRAVIHVKSPGYFRIEVFGPFGSTLALLASDGKRLFIFSQGESRRYRWDGLDFPYPFTSEDMVSFLLGSVLPKTVAAFDSIVQNERGRVIRVTRSRDGKEIFRASMSDFRALKGASLPFSVSIEDSFEALNIKYSTVEINPDITDDIFMTGFSQ
ncbi:MAG: hypothetical protein HZB83_06985 [Deltaproteobacteria bacterium]|nr:hypothetical protein [Deltaproteobacteria bacterium]